MASSPSPSVPKLYSFLGNNLAESFVQRVFVAHGLDMKNSAEFHAALLASVIEQLDNFVLEQLSPEDIQKVYLLKGSNAPQEIITAYLDTQIPQLTSKVTAFLDTVFETVSKKFA